MKTIFTLFAVMAFTYVGFTQPVISNIEPAIGDQFLYTQADNTDYTPGDAGADVFWDFSDLFAQALNDLNYTIIAPSEGEENESFPEATSVWSGEYVFGDTHNYLSFENGEMTILGLKGLTLVDDKYYSNSEKHISFPLTYQDSGNDTFDGHYITALWGFEYPFSGTTAYTVDAYGTIETQYGVFDNVLRVTITNEETITNTSGDQSTINTVSNLWYSQEYRVPVVMMKTTTEVDFDGNEDSSFLVSALATYNGEATKVKNYSKENTFEIYPNPTSEYIVLKTEIQGNAHLKIFSSDGKLVLENLVQSHEKINVSNLSPGYYIANLTSKSSRSSPVSFVVH